MSRGPGIIGLSPEIIGPALAAAGGGGVRGVNGFGSAAVAAAATAASVRMVITEGSKDFVLGLQCKLPN